MPLPGLSPASPGGSFRYPPGLDPAIAAGALNDRASLHAWITALIAHGSGWTDAVLLAEAYAAASDPVRLAEVAELAEAMAPAAERRRETLSQGAAFAAAVSAWAPAAPAPYCIAVGQAAADHGIPLEQALTAWLHAFASNLVSIAMRAVPLGQTDGVAVLAALEPLTLDTAARAAASSLDDLGSCALISDIAAMRHETLPVRLFIS